MEEPSLRVAVSPLVNWDGADAAGVEDLDGRPLSSSPASESCKTALSAASFSASFFAA